MKLATFSAGGGSRLGLIDGDRIIDISAGGGPPTMRELIQAGPEAWALAEGRRRAPGAVSYSLDSVKLLAPLPDPPKIVAIGLNYMDHCREQNVPVPDRPLAAHLYTFYVGTRNGGVWKTVNNGTTFTPLSGFASRT